MLIIDDNKQFILEMTRHWLNCEQIRTHWNAINRIEAQKIDQIDRNPQNQSNPMNDNPSPTKITEKMWIKPTIRPPQWLPIPNFNFTIKKHNSKSYQILSQIKSNRK